MSKQTAVQWLHYHLLHLMQTKEWRSKDLHIEKFDELFVEALAMEREQMGEAFDESRFTNQWVVLTESAFQHKSFQDYYNETYKGGEQ